MKKNWKNNGVMLLLLWLPFVFMGCSEHGHKGEKAENSKEYTCPMHPQIVQDKPGSCPICGMDLVAKTPADAPAATYTSDLNYLLEPANQIVVSSINTVSPVQKQVSQELEMSGVVTYDTRRQYIIPTRVGGRIEKLYVQFNFQPVRKGQKLFDIYSPELVTAQKELLYLLQSDASNSALINGAKQKLRLLGATEGQISQLIRTGKATYAVTVYSPYNGYVLDPAAAASPAPAGSAATPAGGGAAMGGMGGGASGVGSAGTAAAVAAPAGEFSFREGMYVSTGQALLKVVDASQVWGQFNVPPNQASQLRKGMSVTVTFNQVPDQQVQTQISLIEPVFEAGENFARVRVSLPSQNNRALIGQLVTGETTVSTGAALWVPQGALLDLGSQSIAFLQVSGVFKPAKVETGQRADGLVEVLSGLTSQDRIAENAQFLVDSDSFIRVEDNNR